MGGCATWENPRCTTSAHGKPPRPAAEDAPVPVVFAAGPSMQVLHRHTRGQHRFSDTTGNDVSAASHARLATPLPQTDLHACEYHTQAIHPPHICPSRDHVPPRFCRSVSATGNLKPNHPHLDHEHDAATHIILRCHRRRRHSNTSAPPHTSHIATQHTLTHHARITRPTTQRINQLEHHTPTQHPQKAYALSSTIAVSSSSSLRTQQIARHPFRVDAAVRCHSWASHYPIAHAPTRPCANRSDATARRWCIPDERGVILLQDQVM